MRWGRRPLDVWHFLTASGLEDGTRTGFRRFRVRGTIVLGRWAQRCGCAKSAIWLRMRESLDNLFVLLAVVFEVNIGDTAGSPRQGCETPRAAAGSSGKKIHEHCAALSRCGHTPPR